MAVFLAASDEAVGENIFHCAGYVAPVACWSEVLIPAWEEEVLQGNPSIDEFHVTELRSRRWREGHGLTRESAEQRIDTAVDLIFRTKGLLAVRATIDGDHFDNRIAGFKFRLNDLKRKPLHLAIDYPSFLSYVVMVLCSCSIYASTERVDFLIETKKEVFPAIKDFFEVLPEQFVKIGVPRFADILGKLIPGDKKSVPLQAADLLCWHTQRCASNVRNPSIDFSITDSERASKLARYGLGQTIPRQLMENLCDGLFEDWRNLNKD